MAETRTRKRYLLKNSIIIILLLTPYNQVFGSIPDIYTSISQVSDCDFFEDTLYNITIRSSDIHEGVYFYDFAVKDFDSITYVKNFNFKIDSLISKCIYIQDFGLSIYNAMSNCLQLCSDSLKHEIVKSYRKEIICNSNEVFNIFIDFESVTYQIFIRKVYIIFKKTEKYIPTHTSQSEECYHHFMEKYSNDFIYMAILFKYLDINLNERIMIRNYFTH